MLELFHSAYVYLEIVNEIVYIRFLILNLLNLQYIFFHTHSKPQSGPALLQALDSLTWPVATVLASAVLDYWLGDCPPRGVFSAILSIVQ